MERLITATAVLTLVISTVTPTAFAAPRVVPISDEQVARFEGTWLGHDNPTPFGPMSFAMDFQWEKDGSLHSHTALSQQTWVDLRLRKDENDQWIMDESASLAGMGVQQYQLHPVRAAGDTLAWAYLKSPSYLTVRTVVTADNLYMLVLLKGEEHVEFGLPRVSAEEEIAAIRVELEEGRQRSGDDDIAQLEQAGKDSDAAGADDPVEVRNARARVKAAPNDAKVHLELAMVLAEIMETAPQAKVPGYAYEMLGGFQKAVELEPTSADAHFGLAQYYLNAPPLAGGSIEAAAKEAAVLGELESPLGEVVLAQIDAKQGNTQPALARIRKVVDQNPDLEIAQQIHASLSRSEK